ncbi:hypothetical protein HDU97_005516 [Phlyctochytrium planicorne]|nr:hypothetical protein HDU97_005516 [Phlyctochytrium planicorne]
MGGGGCYSWQLVTGATGWNGTSGIPGSLVPSYTDNLYGRIWVLDASEASLPVTKTPSQLSLELSLSFVSLGLVPTINTAEGLTIGDVVFSKDGRYWEFTYNTTHPTTYLLDIDSNKVSLINCHISPAHLPLSVQKFDPSYLFTQSSLPSPPIAVSSFKVYQDACSTNVAVAISNAYGPLNFLLTQSSFAESKVMKTVGGQGDIAGVAMTQYNILFMDTAGDVFVNGTIHSSGITTKVNRIRGESDCDVLKDYSLNLGEHVVAWNDGVGGTSFFYSVNGGSNFNEFSLQSSLADATVTGTPKQPKIRDIALSGTFQNYIVLATDISGVDRVYLVDPFLGGVTNAYKFVSNQIDGGSMGSKPSIWPLKSGAGEVLFAGDQLFYSPNGGRNLLKLTLAASTDLGAADVRRPNEWISQVASDKSSGKLAILTSINRIFWGKAGFPNLLEVKGGSGLLPTDVPYLAFSLKGELQVWTTSGSSTLNQRTIPLESDAGVVPACPFKEFTVDAASQYILDVGQDSTMPRENITIHGKIMPKAGLDNSFSVVYTNFSLLLPNTTVTSHIAAEHENNEVTEYSLETFVAPKSYKDIGKSEILIRPMSSSMSCEMTQATTIVIAGCRSTLQLVFRSADADAPVAAGSASATTAAASSSGASAHLRRRSGAAAGSSSSSSSSSASISSIFSSVDCTKAPESFFLAGGSYVSDFMTWLRPSTPKTVKYDCKTYGLPVPAFYGAEFRPVFDLYDDGVFLRTVSANIGLWEANGRSSFRYSLSAGKAGCLRQPQSWIDLVAYNPVDPISAWGPKVTPVVIFVTEQIKKYRSCFYSPTNDTENLNPNTPYTIFNSTNSNTLIWEERVDGMFLFTARVLDPSYSYCELKTQFAISVYGAPISISEQVGIVFGLMGGVIILLGVSYFLYLRSRKLDAKVKEEEDERVRGEAEKDSSESEQLLWKDKTE